VKTELTYQAFFGPKQQVTSIDAVLGSCLAQKRSLRVSLLTNSVEIAAVDHNHGSICVHGKWRSPVLATRQPGAKALLVAPFAFLIQEIRFPPGTLYTLGRRDRTVADFCMRNYFFAAARKSRMEFQRSDCGNDGQVAKGSRDLAQTYSWIVKTYLKDDLFGNENAIELLLAAAHIPLTRLSNPLLEAGVEEFRLAATQSSQLKLRERKAALLSTRSRLMAVL
jgi:hypothetical protein